MLARPNRVNSNPGKSDSHAGRLTLDRFPQNFLEVPNLFRSVANGRLTGVDAPELQLLQVKSCNPARQLPPA